jgi:hypothetical protein
LIVRLRGALCAAVLVACVCAATASAAPPSAHNPVGRVLGVVPAHGKAASHLAGSGGNLTYHNGPVMHANTVYAIYWVPSGYSVSSNYESLINGYFANVAHDSGLSSNVYYSDTQYYDLSGSIAYNSAFGGSVVDTNTFPASGCRDSYTSICLTDTQIQNEVSRVVKAQGWATGLGTEFFMFTPKNVGSCFGSSSCAFSYYCAYHSQIGNGSGATLYANMPYAAWDAANCGSGSSPNGDDADSTINVTSHEHNETITDPLGTAWYDRRGNEDGDKCAWNFGHPIGSTASGSYNQVIGSGVYYLQQEWSNKSSGCVLTGT